MNAFTVAMVAAGIAILIIWSLISPLPSIFPERLFATSTSAEREVVAPQSLPEPAVEIAAPNSTPTIVPATATPTRVVNTSLNDPEGFITAYYAAYNKKDVETAWSMVSYPAKQENYTKLSDAERLERYRQRMSSYQSVTTTGVRTLSLNPPTIEAIVTYEYPLASKEPNPVSFLATFTLIQAKDDDEIPWRIRNVSSKPYP